MGYNDYDSSPYGGIYETGADSDGDGIEDVADEAVAERVAERLAAEAESDASDTGAVMLPSPGQILSHLKANVGALFGGAAVPPKKLKKVVAKVQAKLPIKAQARAVAPRPIVARPQVPMIHMPARNGRIRKPITSTQDLMSRVTWAQLVSLTSSPLSIAVSTTVTTTLDVTRSGCVLDWSTNTGTSNVFASNLTYGQQPYVLFNAQPLDAWAPGAANPTPIAPLMVHMPAKFNVTLQNTSATAAQFVGWTMSGIPLEDWERAVSDPDVAEFLVQRGMALARSTQGGYGTY